MRKLDRRTKQMELILFTELTKHGRSSYNPVFGWLHRGQPYGYDEVRGVTGGG